MYVAAREIKGDASNFGFGQHKGQITEFRTVQAPDLEGALALMFSEPQRQELVEVNENG
jgi:hypothetical protein